MRRHKPFRGVWLWWNRWVAIQLWPDAYLSIGIHVDFRRPLLDLHLGWIIIAIGSDGVITDLRDRHRHTCRGFLRGDDPIL